MVTRKDCLDFLKYRRSEEGTEVMLVFNTNSRCECPLHGLLTRRVKLLPFRGWIGNRSRTRASAARRWISTFIRSVILLFDRGSCSVIRREYIYWSASFLANLFGCSCNAVLTIVVALLALSGDFGLFVARCFVGLRSSIHIII